jgi:hypothetical protein
MILKHPLVFFGIIPFFYFILIQRYVFALKKYKYPLAYYNRIDERIKTHT